MVARSTFCPVNTGLTPYLYVFIAPRFLSAPVCAVCADGYTSGLAYTCSECNEERRIAAIATPTIVLLTVVAMFVRRFTFLRSSGGQTVAEETSPGGDNARDQRFIGAPATQALKILLVSWQIVTQASANDPY